MIPIFSLFWMILPLSLAAHASESGTFPEVRIESDHTFTIQAPIQAARIRVHPLLTVVASERGLRQCALIAEKIAAEIHAHLNDPQGVQATLGQFFQNARDYRRPLTVWVDDFGERRSIFRSFHLPPGVAGPTDVIGLDCTENVRLDWKSLLAHEMVHAHMLDRGVETWFEEGVAQIIEERAGGTHPLRSALAFHDRFRGEVLHLLEIRRPLPSADAYALGYLFVKYLIAKWGEDRALRDVLNPNPALLAHEAERTTLESIAYRLRHHFEATGQTQRMERANPADLLRFFAAALTLGKVESDWYGIPGWPGLNLSSLPQNLSRLLEPGEFTLLRDPSDYELREAQAFIGQETYGLSWGATRFRITPNPTSPSDGTPQAILVIHPNLPTSSPNTPKAQ